MRLYSILIALLLVNTVIAKDAKPNDYSRGFEIFHKLGVPTVKGLEFSLFYRQGKYKKKDSSTSKLDKICFIHKKLEDGKVEIIKDGWPVTVHVDEKLSKKQKLKLVAKNEMIGKFHKEDLTTFAKRLIKEMKEDKKEKPELHHFRSYGSYHTNDNYLTFATYLFDSGLIKEANEIVCLTLKRGDPEQILHHSISCIADKRLGKTTKAFFKDYKWSDLIASLKELTRLFPVGWSKVKAIKLYLAALEKDTPTTLDLPKWADDLTADNKELCKELLSTRTLSDDELASFTIDRYGGSSYWFLNSSAKTKKSTWVLDKIKAKGLSSFPLLHALAKDNTFTHIPASVIGGGRKEHEGPRKTQSVTAEYNRLHRPATRREIAETLLSSSITLRSRGRSEFKDILDETKKLYKELKGKSKKEIAGIFIDSKDSSKQAAAVDYYLNADDSECKTIIENYILKNKVPFNQLANVRQHIEKRGKSAADFLEKFCLKLRNSKPVPPYDKVSPKAYALLIDKSVKELELLLIDEKVESIVDEMLVSDKPANSFFSRIKQGLKDKKKSESVELLLKGAIKAKKVEQRAALLNLIRSTARDDTSHFYGRGRHYMAMPVRRTTAKADQLNPKQCSNEWRILLADKRSITDEKPKQLPPGYPSRDITIPTIGEMTVDIVNSLYRLPGEDHGDYRMRGDKRMKELEKKRAFARLDGKKAEELPKYPSADNVSEEQRKSLHSQLLNTSRPQVPKFLAKLTWEQELALDKIAAEKEDLSKHLRDYANRIVAIEVTSCTTSTKKSLETTLASFKGSKVTTEVFKPLWGLCKNYAEAGNSTSFVVKRKALLKGVMLKINCSKPKEDDNVSMHYGYRHRGAQGVSAYFNGNGYYGSANWPISAAENDDNDDTLEEDAGESSYAVKGRTEFWSKLGEMLVREKNVFTPVEIRFTGTPRIKTKRKVLSRKDRLKQQEKRLIERLKNGGSPFGSMHGFDGSFDF